MTGPLKPRRPVDPEAAFDAALGAAPLRPTPPGLARAVMARVRGYPVRPRFRLSWLDVALCGLGGAMVGVLLLLRALATPQALARAQNTLSVLLVGGGPEEAVVLVLALAGAGVVAVGLLIAAGVALVLNGSRR